MDTGAVTQNRAAENLPPRFLPLTVIIANCDIIIKMNIIVKNFFRLFEVISFRCVILRISIMSCRAA